MSHSRTEPVLISDIDIYKDVIGVDFRPLPDSNEHPYDPQFFQKTCGEHDGYVLHPLISDDPRRTHDMALDIFELVSSDREQGVDIDDHDLGTLSDDYSDIGLLIDSIRNPSLLIQDVSRHVICGAEEGIVGRLDYQPALALMSSQDSPEMEVAMWIADPFRQRNIASYVLNRFITDMFHEQDGLFVLRAQVLVGNIAAQKLVEQAGFRRDGMIYEDDEEPYQDFILQKPLES